MAMEFNEKSLDKRPESGRQAEWPIGPNEEGLPRHVGDNFQITKDGMRLHPQPTADPLDPLNWSSFKKHLILAIVMWK